MRNREEKDLDVNMASVNPVDAAMAEITAGFNDDGQLTMNFTDIPVIPLRSMVAFPYIMFPVQIGRESTHLLVKECRDHNEAVLLVCQKDPEVENPTIDDLYRVGVVGKIINVIDMPDGTTTAFIVTGPRASLDNIHQVIPYLRGASTELTESVPAAPDMQISAMLAATEESFARFLSLLDDEQTHGLRFTLSQFDNDLKRFHFICANAPVESAYKQDLLEDNDFRHRIEAALSMLDKAYQLMKIKQEVRERTHENISRQQKEAFLQSQIRTIKDELGDAAEDSEIQELRDRAAKKEWSDEARAHFDKEVRKLERYNSQNPEYSIQYSYLDLLLNLPWDHKGEEEIDITKVAQVLDRDHFGLEKVKERILEHISVLKLRHDMKSPIICLYGPPGVGKTSLGKSIADSLGREYARVSLGGLHDEAEIRGHRRTYIGAMPGRIISALAKCGTSNPVFVLDEIDKVGQDFKGDPSTALLEVLDPEQNNKFHDNYVDFDYDLSKVMFVATANSLSTISEPLRDRMEIIEISGYITAEKIEIARRHLVPTSLADHGFAPGEISFSPEALEYMIESYTRESGVRRLSKTIARVLRKIAFLKASGKDYPKEIDRAKVSELLGKEDVVPDKYENNDIPGVVTGLAWTSVGGEILFIESSLSEGKGNLTMTGNLGNVMKESATLALKYINANATKIGIDPTRFEKTDVHIHVPEGAIPKDGPSAGVTMVTSLASSFTRRKVRPKLAMTGEITLRGKVLPVGGIKEKILAAKRAGIETILLSEANRKDIEEITPIYLEGLTFHYVKRIDEVLAFALTDEIVAD